MIVKLLVEGGAMAPGPALAQKLGPLGMNIGEIISKVNEATASFKGTKVPVELDIDTATKEFTIKVSSPPVSELLKKELKIEKGSGEQKKLSVGNLAIEQIIAIAKTKLADALERDLKAMVKTVTGSCVSLGILIESKPAKEIAEQIADGKYDKEIQEQKTEVSPEKRKKLDLFFNKLHKTQEAAIEEEEKAAEEAEKAKEAAAAAAVEGEGVEGEEKPAEGEEKVEEEEKKE